MGPAIAPRQPQVAGIARAIATWLTADARPPTRVIDEALAAKEAGEEKMILFSYSRHGLLDLAAYDDYLHGRLDLG